MEPVWNPPEAPWVDAVPSVLSALTNVVFPVLFVLVYRDAVTRPGLFIRVALACFILNLYWIVQLVREGKAHELLVGYYVWLAAFALLIGQRRFNPSNIENTHGRHASMTATARFSRRGR